MAVQAGFVLLVLLSPARRSNPVGLAQETILFFPPPAVPAPSTIDARGARKRRATAPTLAPVIRPVIPPPSTAPSPLAPPTGLAGFGRSLFGCAPEQYALLTPEQRSHCPKPGEGLAKNDDRDLIAPPKSRAKLEAMWQEQWQEDHWVPPACPPQIDMLANRILPQAKAENRRAQAAWERIADQRAGALAVKTPPAAAAIRSRRSN